MGDTAKDIRKVIKNATTGGLDNKNGGVGGKGNTIATKEEINKGKMNEGLKGKILNKMGGLRNNDSGFGLKKAKSNTSMDNGALQGTGSVDPFKNDTNTPINNIQVTKVDNQSIEQMKQRAKSFLNVKKDDEKFINGVGRAKDLKKPVDVDKVIEDLYLDVKSKVVNGTLSSSDLGAMKEVYPELAGLDDSVILSLIGDLGSIASKNLGLNDRNMEKLKGLYPELTTVSWNLGMPKKDNMYQAGGVREAITSASPVDLNSKGTAGAITEGVINPLGEGFTLLDAAAQTLNQVDGQEHKATAGDWIINPIGTAASKSAGSAETKLKNALSKLTDKDIDNYYKRYQQFQKEHGTLSKLYTTQLEGDTVVEQLWNWVSGKGKQNADAGFRDWMIDQVNNEVNGWAGEFWGTANELEGVGGPNIAKMYANMPASAIKTVTAISKAITNPVDTAGGLVVLVKDARENIENGTFDKSLIGQRYGSWDAFAKALEQDPVGVASDALAVAELGAGTVGTTTKAARYGTRGASMATKAVGAEKTSNNLLKISGRLKDFEKKISVVDKSLGGASDMGVRQMLYGKSGKGGLIGGLEKWASEGDKFSNKAAKYMVNAQQPGKLAKNELKNIYEAGGPIGRIAERITGIGKSEDKLLKAANPNTNQLRNNVDYKNKKKNMDTATKTIVEEGYTPKNTEEWAKAHMETLNKKWKEFKSLIKNKKDVTVKSKDLLKGVKEWLKAEKEGATVNQRGDIVALEKEIADLEKRGDLNMEFLENRKEHYNSSYKDADKMKKGDIYQRGLKKIGDAIREAQDNILGKGPEETKKLRMQIKALMDTKEDIVKANLKNQKAKDGGGLIENYGRISGIGDMLEGTFKTITGRIKEGVPQAVKGTGKLILGKALGRAKDVDFLTERGFKGLKKKLDSEKKAGLMDKGGTAIENKVKEVENTGNGDKNSYNKNSNLDINQNKDGLTKKGKDDTGKSKENLGGLGKKEKDIKGGGVGQKASTKARNDGGRVSQKDGGFIELKTDGKAIVKTLTKIKNGQPDGYKMDIHGEGDYGNGKWKTFQSKDGNSSVTVKDDGDITSLVSKPGLKRGKELVLTAIKNGGDKLDCYEEYLPTLYQKGGFEPVARVKFNPEYAPADWKGKGQDIIVMMRRNNDSVEKVNENWGKYEKVDLDDLPIMEYDDALAYRDMLLEQRKKSYKDNVITKKEETKEGAKVKKEKVGKIEPIWEETVNPKTGKLFTEEEVGEAVNRVKERFMKDKNKIKKLYKEYVSKNTELGEDLQDVFMKDGYINPDGLRPLINREIAKELGVGDNIMASTNHPAVSDISDMFTEMVGDSMIERASKGEDINVALIGGGGGSGKSGGPKAMISEGFIKKGEKVHMTLDVQGGANDIKDLVNKAREKGVLDKIHLKIAYVYASTADAGEGVIKRTVSQNKKLLSKKGIDPDVVAKDTKIGKNRLYAGRTLPFEIFEGGHLKSVGKKGLLGYIDIANDVKNVDFMITERLPGGNYETKKHIVKQNGEWKMKEGELNELVKKMTKNKEQGLDWEKAEKEGKKALEEGRISQRQYDNLFKRSGALAVLLMLVASGGEDEQEA